MQLQMILKLVIRYLILNTLFPFLLEYCDISSKDSRICPLSSTDSIIFEYWVPPKKVVDVDNENFYPFSPKMKRWYDEAYEEINCTAPRPRIETYGIYPKRFYKNVSEMLEVNNKSIDFCFIGGLMKDVRTYQNRHWILSFIEKHFGSDSYLQFTDNEVKVRYEIMGSFDYTLEKAGFVPTYVPYDQRNFFDAEYFSVMSRCKFCLTPAGDNMFSMRFYEALMTKCIPVVRFSKETYRSVLESQLQYFYYMSTTKEFVYHDYWTKENYDIFLEYHTLDSMSPCNNDSDVSGSSK